MAPHPLDNPIWTALTTRHASFAQGDTAALRYVPAVAPFAAVASGDPAADAALAGMVASGEHIHMIGPAPPLVAGWSVDGDWVLAQMVCTALAEPVPGPDMTLLGPDHYADMLALTWLVYPGYFRPRTPEMGRYLGIYIDGRLAAMAGERMYAGEYREISTVCTHPDHAGRGLATRLVTQLCREILQQGLTPFLHVARSNTRAKSLYDRLGFVDRCDLRYWALTREPA